jgi:hypothetical protein
MRVVLQLQRLWLGALQDNDRALIVGRRSYGKGLVQRPFSLNDGAEVRLTISGITPLVAAPFKSHMIIWRNMKMIFPSAIKKVSFSQQTVFTLTTRLNTKR